MVTHLPTCTGALLLLSLGLGSGCGGTTQGDSSESIATVGSETEGDRADSVTTGAAEGPEHSTFASDDGAESPDSMGTVGSSTSAGDGESESSDSTDSKGMGTDEAVYAQDISLTRITINQGIESWLYDEGTSPGPSYPLVSGRAAMVSVGWQVHEGFQPRMLRLVLTVRAPDGTVVMEQERVHMVTASSDPRPLPPAQAWILGSDVMVEGATAAVAAFEMPGVDGPTLPPPGARLPGEPDSFATLPVTNGTARLRVTVVPLIHRVGSCESAAPTGDEVAAAIAHNLSVMYPVQGIDVTLHESVVFDDEVTDTDMIAALTFLAELRAADAPGDDVIYYGLLDPCNSDNCDQLLGQAYILSEPGSAEHAPWRVGVGRVCSTTMQNPVSALTTVQHEIGHVLGRDHVNCSGMESEPDPNYPNEGGLIAGWGADVTSPALLAPSTPEVMSYCGLQRWLSGYGWNLAYDVIADLSALGGSVSVAPPSEPALMVRVDPQGQSRAEWVRIPIAGGEPVEATYRSSDGTEERAKAVAVRISDSADQVLLVAGPSPAIKGAELQWRASAHRQGRIAVPDTLTLGR